MSKVNKITLNGEILIDLTGDTVTPNKLVKGFTAHDKSGELITGTLESNVGPSGVPIEVAELPTPTADTVGKVYKVSENYYVGREIAGSSFAIGEPLGSVILFNTSVDIADLGISAGGMWPVITAQSDTAQFAIIVGEGFGGGDMGHCYLGFCGDMSTGIPCLIYARCDVLTVDQFNEMMGSQLGFTITHFGWQTDVYDSSAYADCIVQENYVAEAGNLVLTGTTYSLPKANEEYYSGVITDLQGEVSSLTVEKNALQEQYDVANNLAVSLEKGVRELHIPDGTTLKGLNLGGCTNLVKLSLPEITERYMIGNLFGGYAGIPTSFETISIRGGEVPDGTFANMSGVANVILEDGVTSIGNWVFSGSSIQNITILGRIITIPERTFDYAYGLKKLVIPDSVTSIEKDAFRQTYRLLNLTIKSPTPPTRNNAGFGDCCHIVGRKYLNVNKEGLKNGYIYVPLASVQTYRTDTDWEYYATQIMPYVETLEELANIDGTTYDKACVGEEDYTEYTYNGTSWEIYTR